MVAEFLDLLAAGELERAADLLDPDVLYTNVSLPPMRGRERVRSAALKRRWAARARASRSTRTRSPPTARSS